MNRNFTRKNFISLFTLGGPLIVTPSASYGQATAAIPAPRMSLDRELVKDSSLQAHALPAVKQLLRKNPVC